MDVHPPKNGINRYWSIPTWEMGSYRWGCQCGFRPDLRHNCDEVMIAHQLLRVSGRGKMPMSCKCHWHSDGLWWVNRYACVRAGYGIPSPITHLQGHQPLLIDPRHPKTKQRFLVVCLTMYIYTVKNMMADEQTPVWKMPSLLRWTWT